MHPSETSDSSDNPEAQQLEFFDKPSVLAVLILANLLLGDDSEALPDEFS
jgi:hypothetical protein